MAKKKRRKREQKSELTTSSPSNANEAWLSNRTGLIVLSVISLVMAAFMAWNLYPVEGVGAILWGLGFGASIWIVFILAFLFNSFLRGKR